MHNFEIPTTYLIRINFGAAFGAAKKLSFWRGFNFAQSHIKFGVDFI